ncbi:AfsR/SARP family transcriptional regulator [Streptomyces yerevanensis]|uniref:AfsR/SARP family transcriptional regulator n=1 Tax=Streptomyces yerevanensis TaxID=66378 RepID=UPI0006894308|nr:BTAD domain-containing putative transcriptional regulator [Streptomyces yerevanensis]
MLFRILGPLQIRAVDEIGSPAQRAILTALLLQAGHPIGVAELAERLWDEPPASATANIRSHLTGLRRTLDQADPGLRRRVRTYRGGQSGYGLHAAPDELDLSAFTMGARRGRSLLLRGDTDAAIAALEEALALWRGPFGQDLPPTRWFNAHVAGLNNTRFDAYQDLFTACLLAGRTEMVTYRIECAIAEAPYRQRLWELLAAAHCVDGDAASALDVIKRCQELLTGDLGLDLPPRVEAMRAAALDWDRDQALRLIAAHATEDGEEHRRPAQRSLS